MSTRLFSSLERKLAPSVPGCPLPVMVQFIRDAAIDVCENTLVWRFEQDAIRLTPGIYEYSYESPKDTEVVAIIHSAMNGQSVPFITQEDLHSKYPAWPETDTDDRSQPAVVSQFNPDGFLVAPVPDAADDYDLKMFLALRPTPSATGMNESIFDEVEALIVHGALYRLFSLPERSWTNADLATYHARQTTFRMTSRRAKANLGVGRATLTVRMVPFN